MRVSDVTGFKLGEARKILDDCNIKINSVKVTAPPKGEKDNFDDSFRVIKVIEIGHNAVDLLVCKPL